MTRFITSKFPPMKSSLLSNLRKGLVIPVTVVPLLHQWAVVSTVASMFQHCIKVVVGVFLFIVCDSFLSALDIFLYSYGIFIPNYTPRVWLKKEAKWATK